MKKSLNISIIIAISIFLNSMLFAQGPGTATASFLLIAPGAKASGMGEGGVALANDATAIYWNPAGLAFQYEDPEVDMPGEASLMHAKWLPQFNFDDLFYDYAAVRYYFEDIGMLGASFTYLSLGENIETDNSGQEVGRFNSQEYAVTLSYATKLEENLGIGVNVKLIRSELAPTSVNVGNEKTEGVATGVALDLGVLWEPAYEIFENRLRFGANLSNFGPAMAYIDDAQADPLPINLRLGFAYKIYDDEFNRLVAIYDANRGLARRNGTKAENFIKSTFYSSWVEGDIEDRLNFTHSLGLEYWYGNLIALRAGYFNEREQDGDRKFLTFGAGLVVDIFGFDFGYVSDDEDSPLSDTMRFSLSVKF